MAKVSSWEESDKKAHEATQGTFIRLENDGDKVVGVFRPHDANGNLCVDAHDYVWNEKLGKNEDFNPQLHAGKNPSTRFTLNFFAIKMGNGKNFVDVRAPKLISFNAKTYKLARSSMEKYATGGLKIDGVVFEIERKGKKGDTQTTYSILPEEPKEASKWEGLVEQIKNAKFFDPEKEKETEPQQTTASNGSGHQQAAQPAAPQIASENDVMKIMDRIKAMPDARAKAEKFLNRFGITRIRDLKASDVSAALSFVDELEGKAPGVVDPFA